MAEQSVIDRLDQKISECQDIVNKITGSRYEYHFAKDMIPLLNELIDTYLEKQKESIKRGFLLLAENGTHPPKYEHHHIEDAHTEAQRLAILTRGNVTILHKTAVVCPDFSVVLNTKSYDSSVIESSKIEKELTKHDDLPF